MVVGEQVAKMAVAPHAQRQPRGVRDPRARSCPARWGCSVAHSSGPGAAGLGDRAGGGRVQRCAPLGLTVFNLNFIGRWDRCKTLFDHYYHEI